MVRRGGPRGARVWRGGKRFGARKIPRWCAPKSPRKLRLMNVNNLIDAIVRQTSVLLAQLATVGGGRAQLANTANQVFLDLVASLREQGLGSRVIADMFGLALRTYQERVRRLSESRTIRGRSLWEAVLEHLTREGPQLRADVLARFRYDDDDSVRGVLRDLVNAGLVYRTGRGDSVVYRALEADQMATLAHQSEAGLLNFVHITVQQRAPITLTELATITALPVDSLERALSELLGQALIAVVKDDSDVRYTSSGCVLSFEDPLGWEAAVFDHYQAMVGALSAKLGLGARAAALSDVVGGSTFGYEVWPGHPHYEVVRGVLQRFRTECRELRERVADHNRTVGAPAQRERVIVYFGQNVQDDAWEQQGDDEQD